MSRQPVLIKCHGDGSLEVYCDGEAVNVQFVDVPDVTGLANVKSNDGLCAAEVAADEFADRLVFPSHRPVALKNPARWHVPMCNLGELWSRMIERRVFDCVRRIGQELRDSSVE